MFAAKGFELDGARVQAARSVLFEAQGGEFKLEKSAAALEAGDTLSIRDASRVSLWDGSVSADHVNVFVDAAADSSPSRIGGGVAVRGVRGVVFVSTGTIELDEAAQPVAATLVTTSELVAYEEGAVTLLANKLTVPQTGLLTVGNNARVAAVDSSAALGAIENAAVATLTSAPTRDDFDTVLSEHESFESMDTMMMMMGGDEMMDGDENMDGDMDAVDGGGENMDAVDGDDGENTDVENMDEENMDDRENADPVGGNDPSGNDGETNTITADGVDALRLSTFTTTLMFTFSQCSLD